MQNETKYTTILAVDLGASSGRVLLGKYKDKKLAISEVSRFYNGGTEVPSNNNIELYWDIVSLWDHIKEAIIKVAKTEKIDAIGVDTWGVDYGLLDANGCLLNNPVCYRSSRTDPIPSLFASKMSNHDLYANNGIQIMQFNTIYQLIAEYLNDKTKFNNIDKILLIPDLLNFWLTGEKIAEVTNASTTGLINPTTRKWSEPLINFLDKEFNLNLTNKLPKLHEPGSIISTIRTDIFSVQDTNNQATPVVAVGSHDTASAVMSVPATHENFAYISCGTWSLAGIEINTPILTKESIDANLTNELGVDNKVRYLKNIMGLWVLQELVKMWQKNSTNPKDDYSWDTLIQQAKEANSYFHTVIDINDQLLFTPGNMEERIVELSRKLGLKAPTSKGEFVICILNSLALSYRRYIKQIAKIAKKNIEVVHLVGGGARNKLLCQLTANALNMKVVSGPYEGTALGNMLVQLQAIDKVEKTLIAAREIVINSVDEIQEYSPSPNDFNWDQAEATILGAILK